jgi:hypothetical protein
MGDNTRVYMVIIHVFMVFVFLLSEGSMLDTSWPVPVLVSAYEFLIWWTECHETEGQDTFCHFQSRVITT